MAKTQVATAKEETKALQEMLDDVTKKDEKHSKALKTETDKRKKLEHEIAVMRREQAGNAEGGKQKIQCENAGFHASLCIS